MCRSWISTAFNAIAVSNARLITESGIFIANRTANYFGTNWAGTWRRFSFDKESPLKNASLLIATIRFGAELLAKMVSRVLRWGTTIRGQSLETFSTNF